MCANFAAWSCKTVVSGPAAPVQAVAATSWSLGWQNGAHLSEGRDETGVASKNFLGYLAHGNHRLRATRHVMISLALDPPSRHRDSKCGMANIRPF